MDFSLPGSQRYIIRFKRKGATRVYVIWHIRAQKKTSRTRMFVCKRAECLRGSREGRLAFVHPLERSVSGSTRGGRRSALQSRVLFGDLNNYSLGMLTSKWI